MFRKRLGPPPDETVNRAARTPVWGTIEQKLDHYNPTDKRTWTMVMTHNLMHIELFTRNF